MKIVFWVLFSLIRINNLVGGADVNFRPIIGVVAQETSDTIRKHYPNYSSYIAASYVKAVEGTAARVVPIPIDQDEIYYRNILRSINGVLLPGGGSPRGPGHPYYDTVKLIYKIAKQINDEGTKFPILAICLGVEFLLTAASNDDDKILETCNVFDEYLPIRFTVSTRTTVLYSEITSKQKKILKKENVTLNWHIWCISLEKFEKSTLTTQWFVTATSTSKNYTFVASVENKKYPFFGIQFHPEKIIYEWETKLHSPEAVEASRYFYDFLTSEARKNDQRFNDLNEEYRSLIYNFPTTYTAEELKFMQVYFDPSAHHK